MQKLILFAAKRVLLRKWVLFAEISNNAKMNLICGNEYYHPK
jgi:hypothetical protein